MSKLIPDYVFDSIYDITPEILTSHGIRAVLVDLEAAMRALGEVTGRTMREDITNRIFERFCVGK